jgi:thiamine transporter ThiT
MPPLPARDQICDVMVSVLTLGVVDLIWFDLLFLMPIQQYFNYIMATSFSGGRSRVPGEDHRQWATNW